MIARSFTAFKMGLYFKVLITAILILRFAHHSSQRTLPIDSLTPEQHFYALSSAPVSPSMRIVVVTQSGHAENVAGLLKSLSNADFDRDTVALDVWMFFSSTCDYLPLPLYPLGMAVFGLPRFDHSIAPAVHDVKWVHGEKTLVAQRSRQDWSRLWESSRGTANESLLFIDAALTTSVSPAFYIWLKKARLATDRGMVASAGVVSLDALSIPDSVPNSDHAVLSEQFFPSTSVFSPTQDVWHTFLRWHAMKRRRWLRRPSLSTYLSLGGYDRLDALRVDPAKAWFSQFLDEYKERVVYPVLPENHTLILRRAGTTGRNVPGTGGNGVVRIHENAEAESSLLEGSLSDIALPERPVLVKPHGEVSTPDAPYGLVEGKIPGKERGANIEDLVDKHAASKYKDVLRRIADFARSRGSESISFTLSTGAFLDTTISWLCNVIALDIAPPAIVIVASDDRVEEQLNDFISQHKRIEQGSLVISMQGAVKAVAYASSPDAALHFGSSEYWMLMLQRTFLIRDLLLHGLSVLLFETDQIWLGDPLPFIRHELHHPSISSTAKRSSDDNGSGSPDMVVTLTTTKEIPGNFFYLRSSLGTRLILSTIVDRFFVSYQRSLKTKAAKEKRFHYIANDQSLLTDLVLGNDWRFARRFPRVRYSVLNDQLFVDGTWFLDFEDENGAKVTKRKHYTSETSLYPVVLNNNFLIGVDAKMKRAQRFGFWFMKKNPTDLSPICDEPAIKKATNFGPGIEHGIRTENSGLHRKNIVVD